MGYVSEKYDVLKACEDFHVTMDEKAKICPECGKDLQTCVAKVRSEMFGFFLPAYRYTPEFVRWR